MQWCVSLKDDNYSVIEKRFKELLEEHGEDFILNDDGFYVWRTESCYLTSAQLREIADYLDEKNEPFMAELNAYFEGKGGIIKDESP